MTIRELAEEHKSCMMDAGELLALAKCITNREWFPKNIIVEIGAYQGRTSAFMARVLRMGSGVAKSVPVLSIDPFDRIDGEYMKSRGLNDGINPTARYQDYLETVKHFGVERQCHPLVAFSQDVHAIIPPFVGVLVVDGGHDYQSASDDLRLYHDKVVSGGYVFVDDYGPAYPGVMRATDEFELMAGRQWGMFEKVHQSYFSIFRRIH